ncbi:hypothetical protein [Aridibaculum aurantiacum]|uniref:hypothetical protein n=1 Tax=Aridibaculum aurantiacum TaxID=2810307 RepID=UPI001A95D91E|nr:hypothetical protein [Aridibaculum aurantiacum]
MNPSLDKALYYLTGNGNIDEVPVEKLEQLTQDYPFFSVGHLLLAKRLKMKEDKAFQKQLQKASIYISNPYWLHYQLLNFPPTDLHILADGETTENVSASYNQPATEQTVEENSTTSIESISSTTESAKEDYVFPEEGKIPSEEADLNIGTAEEDITSTATETTGIFEEEPAFDNETSTGHTTVDIEHGDELQHQETAEEASQRIHQDPAPINNEGLDESDSEPELQEEPDQITRQENDVPITTEFTQEEIEAASEMAHEHLAEPEPLPAQDEEVPITTEFTQDEIEAASELAHEQLADPEPIPALDEEVPITTEFTQDEIEAASELAHEHLGEPGPVAMEVTEPPFTTTGDAATGLEENRVTTLPIEQEPAFNEPTTSQAEEELAALSRPVDETTLAFIEEVEEENINKPAESTSALALVDDAPDEHELMFQNIKAMLDATTDEVAKGGNDALIPIDPYHAIDYFASQGIKLDLEANPQDKLGKKLRRFTQWLKHMKKLGPEDALENEGEPADAEVQQDADTSNTVREVVTEAMAQVLEKQGKHEKAIQLYTKLSFLNPHKSAYFADKIKNLKAS